MSNKISLKNKLLLPTIATLIILIILDCCVVKDEEVRANTPSVVSVEDREEGIEGIGRSSETLGERMVVPKEDVGIQGTWVTESGNILYFDTDSKYSGYDLVRNKTVYGTYETDNETYIKITTPSYYIKYDIQSIKDNNGTKEMHLINGDRHTLAKLTIEK